jgi:lysozyme
MTAEILDLSHWQRVTDWGAVRAAGIAAVILKATQGSGWTDPTFLARVLAAREAGLLVGAYHFLDASDPEAQAAHFVAVAGALPVLALDIEANHLPGGTVSVGQAAEMAMRVAARTGRAPLVYIGRYGPDGRGTGLPNTVLARCPLWLPFYGTAPVSAAGWDRPTLWQYTNAGSVPGIAGPVDRSVSDGDAAALREWWSGAA